MKPNYDLIQEGSYSNVPEPIYRAADAVSQSELKEFGNAASPLHFKARKPKEPTPDMEFGVVSHTAILQPELLASSYYERPDEYLHKEKNGEVTKKKWNGNADVCKKWLEERTDLPILTSEKVKAVTKIAERIRFIPEVSAALKTGQKELSHIKRDLETGLLLKCRVDLQAVDADGKIWIFDFKKVQSGCATEREFAKSCANYGYFIQASYYLNITGADRFIFVPFDDDEPYDACLFEPGPDELSLGYRQWRKLLNDYAKCKKEDLWPGYPSGIRNLNMPKWMEEL